MKTRIIKNEYSDGKVDYQAEYKQLSGEQITAFLVDSILWCWTLFMPFFLFSHYLGWKIIPYDGFDYCFPTIEEAKEAIDKKLKAESKKQEEVRLSKIKTVKTIIKYP